MNDPPRRLDPHRASLVASRSLFDPDWPDETAPTGSDAERRPGSGRKREPAGTPVTPTFKNDFVNAAKIASL